MAAVLNVKLDHPALAPRGQAASLLVGTSGWTIPARHAYDMPFEGTHLERYAQRFPAVEITSSFYRSHSPEAYALWARSVPPSFRFAVKLPRAISHEAGLRGCEALVRRFAGEVAGLGENFGALLIQLPPSLEHDAKIVEDFFVALPRYIKAPVVCEPRHPSWFTPEAEARLRALQVARAAADPAPAEGASEPGGWSGLVYYRLHGSPRKYYSDYDAAALSALQAKLKVGVARGVPTWCIFDNTAAYAAMGNALTILDAGRS
ncbi:MAG: DUF72 domain-containing protein [Beijerinckiaceae bacterium]|jgi:uncharacterized protein YecE (DUF72 family)